MAKYIDAEAFFKSETRRCGSIPIIGTCTTDNESLAYRLSTAPTADVVEVRHGRWKRVRWVKCDDPDGGYWIVRCNQCSIPHFKEYNFCPSCGARMDGDADDL